MGEPVIIEHEDESIVIIVEQDPPTIVQADLASAIRLVGPDLGYVLPIVDGRVVVTVQEPVSQIIQATGGGGAGPSFRDIINYDGGHPDTHYGNLPHLVGGGVSDPFYYTL